MTAVPSNARSLVRVLWMDHPADHLSHAWRHVVDGGNWQALCGLVADPATLTVPEDEYGRHDGCLLKLGDEIAHRHDDVRAKMRMDMRSNGP